MKTAIDRKNNSIIFSVDTKIYPKIVLYKACYVFIDKVYILLSPLSKNIVSVEMKGKKALSKKDTEMIKGEFMNELLNALVRENVSKSNKKVIEQIVGGAIVASLGEAGMGGIGQKEECGCEEGDEEVEKAVESLRRELASMETESDYEADSLGIRKIASAAKNNPKSKKNGKRK